MQYSLSYGSESDKIGQSTSRYTVQFSGYFNVAFDWFIWFTLCLGHNIMRIRGTFGNNFIAYPYDAAEIREVKGRQMYGKQPKIAQTASYLKKS